MSILKIAKNCNRVDFYFCPLNFLLLFLLQNLRLFQHLFCLFLCLLRSLIFYRKFTDADKDPRDSKGNKAYAGAEGVAEGSYTGDTEESARGRT